MLEQGASPSRRFNSRVRTNDHVWVYWHCNGRAETSRVQDVGLGGMFVETATAWPLGAKAEMHFLVQEGQIRTQAVVRHVEKGRGIGLKFTAVKDEDRPHLVSLLKRARSESGVEGKLETRNQKLETRSENAEHRRENEANSSRPFPSRRATGFGIIP